MDAIFVSERKADLQAALAGLKPPKREEMAVERHADAVDQGASYATNDAAAAESTRQSTQAKEIQAALSRITDGTYGTCEECDEEIPLARLKAVPWAHLCIRCKEREEEYAKLNRPRFQRPGAMLDSRGDERL